MNEPYLIAHLVRSEPAFDIAEQIEIGDEIGWIIPTSGHRAYPFWAERLMANMQPREGCPTTLDVYWVCSEPTLGFGNASIPDFASSVPDHYAANDRHRMKAIDEDTLLAKETAKPGEGIKVDFAALLGIKSPKPLTITRR